MDYIKINLFIKRYHKESRKPSDKVREKIFVGHTSDKGLNPASKELETKKMKNNLSLFFLMEKEFE